MITSERRYDIDWLRVIAFYILIIFHVGMIFVPWDFHIKNNQTLEWFETWMAFLHQWRLPLLFMISGIVIHYSLGRRSGKEFTLERLKRLFIPLLFGTFVIVPPQIYIERISNGVKYANYMDFWKTVFSFITYPEGSFSWHHLWYVAYILVYSFVAYPIFRYFKSERSIALKNKISTLLDKHSNGIYTIIFPMLLFYFTLGQYFPESHDLITDWYNHSISFTLFIFGFLISSIGNFWDILVLKRKQSLVQGLIPAFLLILFVWGPTFYIPAIEESGWFIYLYGTLKMIMIPSLLLAFLGYGKSYLNKPGKLLAYANESVYPFYILHQSVMIVLGYFIIQLDISVYFKFILTIFATFSGSYLLYEFIIRHYNITRILFGLKSLPKMRQKANKSRVFAPNEN